MFLLNVSLVVIFLIFLFVLIKMMFYFQTTNSAGFLLDSMFDFAERFNALNLMEEEIALFSAIVLLSPGEF